MAAVHHSFLGGGHGLLTPVLSEGSLSASDISQQWRAAAQKFSASIHGELGPRAVKMMAKTTKPAPTSAVDC